MNRNGYKTISKDLRKYNIAKIKKAIKAIRRSTKIENRPKSNTHILQIRTEYGKIVTNRNYFVE